MLGLMLLVLVVLLLVGGPALVVVSTLRIRQVLRAHPAVRDTDQANASLRGAVRPTLRGGFVEEVATGERCVWFKTTLEWRAAFHNVECLDLLTFLVLQRCACKGGRRLRGPPRRRFAPSRSPVSELACLGVGTQSRYHERHVPASLSAPWLSSVWAAGRGFWSSAPASWRVPASGVWPLASARGKLRGRTHPHQSACGGGLLGRHSLGAHLRRRCGARAHRPRHRDHLPEEGRDHPAIGLRQGRIHRAKLDRDRDRHAGDAHQHRVHHHAVGEIGASTRGCPGPRRRRRQRSRRCGGRAREPAPRRLSSVGGAS